MEELGRDTLTGLCSRRAFDERLKAAIVEARAKHRSLSVAHVDPDRLFLINQEHGWQVGDEWLIGFAVLARQCVRKTDVIARYSGGEFAVLLPDTDAQSARAILRDLCDAVSSTAFRGANGATFTATVSIGIAQLQPEAVDDRSLMYQARAATREAEQCGGNCVKVAIQAGG